MEVPKDVAAPVQVQGNDVKNPNKAHQFLLRGMPMPVRYFYKGVPYLFQLKSGEGGGQLYSVEHPSEDSFSCCQGRVATLEFFFGIGILTVAVDVSRVIFLEDLFNAVVNVAKDPYSVGWTSLN